MVWDMRTATKWRVLEGHTGTLAQCGFVFVRLIDVRARCTGGVSCLSFSPRGNALVSYSADEESPSLRIWSTGSSGALACVHLVTPRHCTGSTGFLSNLMGVSGKCIRTIEMPKLPSVPLVKLISNVQVSTPCAPRTS